MVSVVVCDMVFVRSGAPRSYPGAPSLALRAIHLVPQGTFSCLAAIHLAPLPGRQDSLASQAKTLISGMITKTRSNAAQSLLQIRRLVLNGLAQTLVYAILTRNTKTKTEDVPVLGLQTVQSGRKKEPCFRTALQKFTSADIHLRTARQARLHARGCLLQCRSCCP